MVRYYCPRYSQSCVQQYSACLLYTSRTGNGSDGNTEQEYEEISLKSALKLPGAKAILTAFFCYCALEATTGLWAGSYMVLHKGIGAGTAAKWASLFLSLIHI